MPKDKVIIRKYAVSVKMLESDWLSLLDMDPEEDSMDADDSAVDVIESLIQGAFDDSGLIDSDNLDLRVVLAD